MLDTKTIQVPLGTNGGRLDLVRSGFPAVYVSVLNDTAVDLYFNIGQLTQPGLSPILIRAYSTRSFDINQAQDFTFFYEGAPLAGENQITIFFADRQLNVTGATLSPRGDSQAVYVEGGEVGFKGELPAGDEHIGSVSIDGIPVVHVDNFAATQTVHVDNLPALQNVQVQNFPTTQSTSEVPFASITDGTKSATTTADKISTSSAAIRSILIQADPDNTDRVLVGSSAGQHFKVPPGGTLTLPINSADKVYVKAVTGTQTVNFIAGV